MDMQSNLEIMENSEFEDLVLPSKQTKLAEMEIFDIKGEPFEFYEEKKTTFFESVQVGKKQTILKLYDELDGEKYENGE